MRNVILIIAVCLGVAGCATAPAPTLAPVPTPAPAPTSADFSPVQAVLAAAEGPLTGTFLMEVKATGRQDQQLYLNSETDYRDQRCLTISIPQDVADEFRAKLAGDPATLLKGRKIRVSGTAERVRIWFFAGGVKTDKYYFQTHVKIAAASQITLL